MKKTILVVEDNDDIRENTAELLTLEGFEVIAVDNGDAAVRIAGAKLPDLIICDVVMIGLDGYAVHEALKAHENTAEIPFIFSTAQSQLSDIQKAIAAGVKHYLVKPFDGTVLLESIHRCLVK